MSGFESPKSCETHRPGKGMHQAAEVWRSESVVDGEILRPQGIEGQKWMEQGQPGRLKVRS
jgi:hypothetical protein